MFKQLRVVWLLLAVTLLLLGLLSLVYRQPARSRGLYLLRTVVYTNNGEVQVFTTNATFAW